jgi:threonine dehydratase
MLSDSLEATRALRPFLSNTPFVHSVPLSRHFAREVWLKLETESPVGSFKARGALYCLITHARQGHRVFVTASTGNHGMAVAYAGRVLGFETHIFVPSNASPRKIRLIEQYTSHLTLTEVDFDDAKRLARDLAEREGYYFIDDGGEPSIVAGTGTIGLEILAEWTPEAVIVPVGNGALISGIGTVMKALSPATRVIGVQPQQAPTMYLSWKERRPVQLEKISTIADGLASRVAVPEAVETMLNVVDDMVLVSEQQMLDAMSLMLRLEGRIIEPSAAAAVAALGLDELHARDVAAIMTGRNCETPL